MEQPTAQGEAPRRPPPRMDQPTAFPDESRRPPPMPKPEELVEHYVSQGMDQREASLHAIGVLQDLLVRTSAGASAASRRGAGATGADYESLRRIDIVGARLATLEAKLDAKPGFPGAVSAGIVAGAIVVGAREVWIALKSATSGKHD